MTRPSWGVRLIGKPYVCLSLLIFYALIIWGWYAGNVHWWVALLAVGGAQHAFRCHGASQRYNAWLAEWNGMLDDADGGRRPASPSPDKKRLWPFVLAVAIILAVGMPLCLPFSYWTDSNGLFSAWFLSCAFITVKAVYALFKRRLRSKAMTKKAGKAAKTEDFVVAWALPRPSASPSWQSARQQVPDHCAYLLAPKQQPEQPKLRRA